MRVWVCRWVSNVTAIMYVQVDEERIFAFYPSGEVALSKVSSAALARALNRLDDDYEAYECEAV